YKYDALGQVESVQTTGRQDMKGKSVPTGSYVDLAGFVSKQSSTISGKQTFTYDKLGHVLSDGRFTYGYDWQGRLTAVVDGWAGDKEKIFFYYDALGRRIASVPTHTRQPGVTWNKTAQWYLYDGNHEVADLWLKPPGGEADNAAPLE